MVNVTARGRYFCRSREVASTFISILNKESLFHALSYPVTQAMLEDHGGGVESFSGQIMHDGRI